MPGYTTSMLAALANRRFTAYLLASASADTGWWMASIAQGWLVLQLTNSPLWLGIVAACAQVPFLLFSIAGGDVADRFDRRAAIAIGNGVIAALAALLCGLVVAHAISIPVLAVAVFLIGSIVALEHPIDRSWVYDLAGPERLGTSIALSSLEWSVARTAGPALGGTAVAIAGVASGYAAFAFLSLPLVALAVVLGRRRAGGANDEATPDAAADERSIVPFCLMIATFTMGVTPYITMLPDIARHHFGLDVRGYGIFAAAGGIGAVAGASGLAAIGEVRDLGRVVPAAAAAGALLLVAFTTTANTLAGGILLAGMGIVDTMMYALANTFVQRQAPQGHRGRANAIFSLAFLGGIPVGNLLVGSLAARIGSMHALFWSSMIALAGCTAFWFVAPSARDADRRNAPRASQG